MTINGLDAAQDVLGRMAALHDRRIIVSNDVPYAPLVQSDEQVAIHRGRWATVSQAITDTESDLNGLGDSLVAGRPIEPSLVNVGRELLAQLQREPAELPGQRYQRTHQLRDGWAVKIG